MEEQRRVLMVELRLFDMCSKNRGWGRGEVVVPSMGRNHDVAGGE